jgi:hypothetical protein
MGRTDILIIITAIVLGVAAIAIAVYQPPLF